MAVEAEVRGDDEAAGAEPVRQPASFEFACDGPVWKGIPVVNGHQVMSVTSADVHLDARSVPEVTLRLWAADAVKLGLGGADVKLDDGTREALVSLGWTPPDDGGTCACGSRHPEGYECAIGPIPPETATAGEIAAAVPRRDGYRIA
jgi:hypothetical protein